ncbi:MAG TPA: hypothetical protein VF627_10015 [Abditibacterium sp.]|jgi:hypothetical protein
MKNPFLPLFAPADALSSAIKTDPAPKKPLVRAAFNREVAAELSEAKEIVLAAREAPFAPMLLDDYDVSAAFITEIESKADQAAQKYGLAAGGSQSGKADTAAKQALEDALDAAIRRIQTGARLTFPTSAPDQKRFGIGIDLENAEDQVELLVPQILEQLKTETLRSVKPEHIAAVKSTFEAWEAAGGAQKDAKGSAQSDRAGGLVLLKELRPMVREVKICIDGQFPYDAPNTPDLDISVVRRKFHLPEKKPFAPPVH